MLREIVGHLELILDGDAERCGEFAQRFFQIQLLARFGNRCGISAVWIGQGREFGVPDQPIFSLSHDLANFLVGLQRGPVALNRTRRNELERRFLPQHSVEMTLDDLFDNRARRESALHIGVERFLAGRIERHDWADPRGAILPVIAARVKLSARLAFRKRTQKRARFVGSQKFAPLLRIARRRGCIG